MAAVVVATLGLLVVGLSVLVRRWRPRRPTGLGSARVRRAREL